MSQKITHLRDYAEARSDEFPSIGAQLDALWKAIESLGTNLNIAQEAEDMLTKIKAIKAKYPKS